MAKIGLCFSIKKYVEIFMTNTIYFPHKYCLLLCNKYEPMKADTFTAIFFAELTGGLSNLSSAGEGQLFRWAMLPMIVAMVSFG